jgi:hypothetical protein
MRRYAVLRVAKIKGMGHLKAAALHNLREREAHNARPEAREYNSNHSEARSAEDVLEKWKERAPEKIRSNAVHALEYVITASPETIKDMSQERQDAYFDDALDWLREKHGPENILSAVVHRDEITPHLQVLVIPLDDRERLNARGFVGGKDKLRTIQTDFARDVGLKHGLERGLERSGARHETIRSYYARAKVNHDLRLELPERGSGGPFGAGRESDAQWRERASEAATEALRSYAAQVEDYRGRAERELGAVPGVISTRDARIMALEGTLERVDLDKRLAVAAERVSGELQFAKKLADLTRLNPDHPDARDLHEPPSINSIYSDERGERADALRSPEVVRTIERVAREYGLDAPTIIARMEHDPGTKYTEQVWAVDDMQRMLDARVIGVHTKDELIAKLGEAYDRLRDELEPLRVLAEPDDLERDEPDRGQPLTEAERDREEEREHREHDRER